MNGRILLADDDENFREMTRILLLQQGYECDTAANAPEAERLLRENAYELLISDIHMPGNVDLQLIANVPQIQTGLPVILVTGEPSVDSAVKSIGLSVVAYLIKPVARENLLTQVQQAIDRYQFFKAIVQSRQRFQQATADLENIEQAFRHPSTRVGSDKTSVNALINLTMQNTVQSLLDLRRLIELMQPQGGATDLPPSTSCPLVLQQILWETIAVLEKTKTQFKSKELAQIRSKLEKVLGAGPGGP